jgi:uncharacterized protein YndB with AHSA1/START domain
MTESVSVSREIAAPAAQVYAMVSDLARMGEWSNENTGGSWLGDATEAAPGARFRGRNRNGLRAWRTLVTITDAVPGRHLGFRVSLGPVSISQWRYDLEPTEDGCRVTETWRDLRPRWFMPIATLATGVADRPSHTEQGIALTLERLGAAAEDRS